MNNVISWTLRILLASAIFIAVIVSSYFGYLALKIRQFHTANIEHEVLNATNRNDYRFLCCDRFIIIGNDSLENIERKGHFIINYGSRTIPFTSDLVATDFELKYNRAANEYSAKYNQRLIKEISEKK
jgi:hypothetical protein